MALSREEDILNHIIDGTPYTGETLSRVEVLLKKIANEGGGGGGSSELKFLKVDTLPAEGDKSTIYLVLSPTEGFEDIYQEYVFIDGSWEKLGQYQDGTGIDFDKLTNKPAEIASDYIDSLFN